MKCLTEVMLIMQGKKDPAPATELEPLRPFEKVLGTCSVEIVNLHNYIAQLAKKRYDMVEQHLKTHHQDEQGRDKTVSAEEYRTVCGPFHEEVEALDARIEILTQIMWIEVRTEIPETTNFDGGIALRVDNKIVAWNRSDDPRNPFEDMARIRIRTVGPDMGSLAAVFRGMSHSR
jgi:hypothetical protein